MSLADPTMLTWVWLAQVYFLFAPFAFITIFALADKVTEAIFTSTTIETRIGGTFIDIRLASRSIESTCTLAFISCYNIDTITPVFTRLTETLVDFSFAISSCIAWFTLALKQKRNIMRLVLLVLLSIYVVSHSCSTRVPTEIWTIAVTSISTHREHKQFQKLAPTRVLWPSDTTYIASNTNKKFHQLVLELSIFINMCC